MEELLPEDLDRLEAAHRAKFDRPGGVARQRLLAALPEASSPPETKPAKEKSMVRKYWKLGAAIAASLVFGLFFLQFMTPVSAFAQTAKSMRDAKGFTTKMIVVMANPNGPEMDQVDTVITWSAKNGIRIDDISTKQRTLISPKGDELEIQPENKLYLLRPKPRGKPDSMISVFWALVDGTAKADKQLGEKTFGKTDCIGYLVSWDKATGDEIGVTTQIWLDKVTKLPVRIDLHGVSGQNVKSVRYDEFVWGEPDAKLFDRTIPEGYKEAKASPLSFTTEEITEFVTATFKAFAKYDNGQYPKGKRIYGDTHAERLAKLMDLTETESNRFVPQKDSRYKNDKHKEYVFAAWGTTYINGLQRDNEGTYYGNTVTAKDNSKVLFSWKLDIGDSYRVIYGDLKAETVSEQKLKDLLK
jgi:outer membrane lipoprotein-sorting protein